LQHSSGFQLGNAYVGRKQHGAAVGALRHAVAVTPQFVAFNIMGNALTGLGQRDEAIEAYRRALAINSRYPPALFNLGKRLAEQGRFDDAVASFRHALASAGPKADKARLSDIYSELGGTLMELDRLDEALQTTRTMREVGSDGGRADWQESLVLLTLGRLAEGWKKYESRYAVEGQAPPHARVSVIDPANLAGQRILVCAERGFGDTIFFARYVHLLLRAGATVSLSVFPELKSLFRGLEEVASVVEPGEPEPEADAVTAFPSLPLAFHTELASIPATVPYLRPPAPQLAAWRERLGRRDKPRIGVCWWGPQHIPHRSIPVASLAPLLDRTEFEFHSLQKEISPWDRQWLTAHPGIREHGDALMDFAETAALISLMDLVITIDRSVAHLAGALAQPVWIMLPFAPDWRWLRERSDSPWYPTARLLRQPKWGDWNAVVAAIARTVDEERRCGSIS
jgi:predicted negative regulator of RcsB-dependent stress response